MSSLRQAELIAALSLATDLGTGTPMGQTLRITLLGVRLGSALGLGERDLADVFYVSLLRSVGCTADAHQAAIRFGDELAAFAGLQVVDMTRPPEMIRFLLRHVGEGNPPVRRARMVLAALAAGPAEGREAVAAHCEVARRLTERMGLGAGVRQGVGDLFERWDGRGMPHGVKADGVSVAAHVVQVARDAAIFYRLGGAAAASAKIRQGSGRAYAPHVAACLLERAPQLLPLLDTDLPWEEVLAAEPPPHPRLADTDLDQALEAVADFVDLKSPYTLGHSRGVAELAGLAARRAGLPEADVVAVRQAGLVHDLGRVGVSAAIWDKKGRLSEAEWERVRLHPYYTERILARPSALAGLASLAASHHERLDGSGYHRGVPGSVLSMAARILAAADAYHAMTEPRPHRDALSPTAAASELRLGARQTLFDGEAVEAVLAAAGHRTLADRRQRAAGLSAREIEVLRLIARGLSTREIAGELGISAKTADHHIQHIYNKTGLSTRAGVTLFALENHLT